LPDEVRKLVHSFTNLPAILSFGNVPTLFYRTERVSNGCVPAYLSNAHSFSDDLDDPLEQALVLGFIFRPGQDLDFDFLCACWGSQQRLKQIGWTAKTHV
jgi:hypothetical protein